MPDSRSPFDLKWSVTSLIRVCPLARLRPCEGLLSSNLSISQANGTYALPYRLAVFKPWMPLFVIGAGIDQHYVRTIAQA